MLGTVVLGFALPYAFLAALNVAQRSTPDELQGRVSAALTFALFAPQAILQTAGSALITTVSYIDIYVGSAAMSLVITAWLTMQRANTSR